MTHTSLAFPFRRHALALALALATGASNAATINVTGACTLVNAINNANADADTDGSASCPAGSSGADILNLKANATYTLTTVNNNTGGANGLPIISSNITINGNAATVERSNATDTPYFRLLQVSSQGKAVINTLKLAHGNLPEGDVGGILNEGSVILNNTTVSEHSSFEVGGILNKGHMALINSTVTGNSSQSNSLGFAGGIDNQGSMTLTDSTVSENRANYATGGILNQGSMTLTNSPISNNHVQYNHGGIVNIGDMTLVDGTITGNYSTFGSIVLNKGNMQLINTSLSGNDADYWAAISNRGSIMMTNSTISGNDGMGFGNGDNFSEGGTATLTNTSISNNSSWGLYNRGGRVTLINSLLSNCVISQPDPLSLQGNNFISDGSCGAPLSGDPKLRPLLDNGGLTFTHALHGDSPALAAADKTLCPNTDQRNVKRPPKNKAACDLGAFERKPVISTSVAPLVSFFDTAAASGGLVGVNNFDERIALRNQLLTAGDYQQRNLAIQACSQLSRTLGYIDPDNTPEADDYVSGSAAQALADEINSLKTSWSCQQP